MPAYIVAAVSSSTGFKNKCVMETNIELLEKEINSLSPSWNLFRKIDKMKNLIKEIKKESINHFEFDAEIQKKAFTMHNNHGILELKLPYSYDSISSLDIKQKLKVSLNYKS
jgi:hypothetical protein